MARAFLKIVAGAKQGMNVPLPDEGALVIGRQEGDLVLEDPMVSGKHLQVLSKGTG